jgi:methyl-accepting chemotaxis protein
MKLLFAPAVTLLDRLDLRLKFTLIAILFLPYPVLLVYLVAFGGVLPTGIHPWLLSGLFAAFLGFYLLTGIYISLSAMVDAFVAAIDRFSAGDLAAHLHVATQDQFGHVALRFNEMRKNLKRMIARISGGSVMVAEAAAQLSDKSRQVTQMAQQQSDAASSVAATMEEMSTSIAMVAHNASDAEKHSAKASEISIAGENVVREASSEMSRIAESFGQSAQDIASLNHRTEEINAIVHVIKEISDQTNLLALNAAIEAARAGEQGRGFAVVADEVRKLAERTGKATEEIAAMIGNIQASMKSAVGSMDAGSSQVRQGVDLTSRAGDTLSAINESSRELLGMVHDIANAVQEQTAASHQIAENIERISTMAEASSVNMTAMLAEAENLGKVSGALREAISLFSGGTADDARQLVEKGVALVAAKGTEKAFADFMNPAGEFIKRDLYLFVYDLQGKVLAHGGNPSLIGKSMIDARDANGKLFIKERINIANAQGSGWQDYMFNNPESNVIESKTSYICKVKDMIVGCGVYK